MYPDLYLYVERARGRELRAEAERHRQGRRHAEGRAEGRGSLVRGLETRLGWVLVEAGLRLVHRRAVDY
ncbi:hypothetical protein AB0C27_22685 [Nonomuraea sp. NPDC048882]|uniref:hypothetical protein n=1 Tax=unclassified Nonomuraea TaxID=2593643 RepID=UPI000AA741E6